MAFSESTYLNEGMENYYDSIYLQIIDPTNAI